MLQLCIYVIFNLFYLVFSIKIKSEYKINKIVNKYLLHFADREGFLRKKF